jgi:serine/threonine-protein kinase
VVAAMVFLVKAGMLSGRLYFYAALYCLTSVAMSCMPTLPDLQLLLFGLVAWASFFFPGLKYYRLRNRQTLLSS